MKPNKKLIHSKTNGYQQLITKTAQTFSRSAETVSKNSINPSRNSYCPAGVRKILSRTINTITPTWVQNGYELGTNYIGFSRANAYRTFLFGAFVSIEAINSYFILEYFQKERTNFFGLLEKGEYTSEEFNKAFFAVVQAIVIYIGCRISSATSAELLINSTTVQMKKDLAQAWIQSGTYNGINYLTNKENPVVIVAHDVREFVSSTINLLRDLIEKTAGLLLAVASLSVLLNYELSLTCLLLVGLIKIAASYCGSLVKELFKKVAAFKQKEISDFHDIHKFSESIALSGGTIYEQAVLLGHIEAALSYNNQAILFNNTNSFIQAIKGFGSWAVGTYLCKEKLLDKTMNMGDAFSIGDSLEALIQFVTWNDTQSTQIISGQTAFERIQTLWALINEWKNALVERDKHFIITNTSGSNVHFKGVIKKPNGEALFKGMLNFEAGKAFQLVGPSGIGKSTIIRALAGLWPYVEGELSMPESVHIVPQTSYIKGGDTLLLDIIRYPKTDVPTKQEVLRIKYLLNALGFSPDSEQFVHLEDRNWINSEGKTVNAQWSFSLSGGERQRIGIISAIIKEPRFLILDEATSAIDPHLKSLVENMIKKLLPATCILFVDHNPSGLFADNLRTQWFIGNKDESALKKQPRLMITNTTPLSDRTIAEIKKLLPKAASVLSISPERFADEVINVADYSQ